jgi:hypothetical protein
MLVFSLILCGLIVFFVSLFTLLSKRYRTGAFVAGVSLFLSMSAVLPALLTSLGLLVVYISLARRGREPTLLRVSTIGGGMLALSMLAGGSCPFPM